ncbi:MAG: aspartyl protease family protein [Caldilineaceae bacterium]
MQDSHGGKFAAPFLPITLQSGEQTLPIVALVDTGAAISVLPYTIGSELGLVWSEHNRSVQLGGNLARSESRAALLTGRIGKFEPIRLLFAWTRSDEVPVILGQINFFPSFDVCFFASSSVFELSRKQSATAS